MALFLKAYHCDVIEYCSNSLGMNKTEKILMKIKLSTNPDK